MKYNKLTIVEEYRTRTKQGRSQRRFKCSCDCGKSTDVEKAKVIGGITKSCGCIQEGMRRNLGKIRMLPKFEASMNEVFSVYKKGARKRGFSFELSKEKFIEIITKECIYCGDRLTNLHDKESNNGNFSYTGIDRYDNSIGYTVDNSVPCCRVCNRIKTNMTTEQMYEHLNKIIKNAKVWQRTA